jgi:hypothetical protein
MKPKHYLVSFGMAVVLMFVSQVILIEPGNAACLNGASNCAREDYFNKYGWPFAFKSVSGIADMNKFAEYSPAMMMLDILIAFALIVIISLLVIKYKSRKQV